ncbi:hypothetical protein HQ886_09435 [Enterococcus faecium]|uniref:hypothetical protein n=1 Tax=Enterococcus durans TaxID=53345 RepID=UPI000E5CB8C3|nr:hypothetical protein [Enterococcus durans]EME3552282.1 hypothetical protein [Enterococcus faecium]MBX9042100.1 hypothetical protein [Enterococcus durans]MBX9078622.1 hypothetical protein [Enterococcus durans]NTQ65059.1 hypothetical protein [Enterococcus faecium]RGW65777.1 hypothetical protein DWV63_07525 [Enterococcus durans]
MTDQQQAIKNALAVMLPEETAEMLAELNGTKLQVVYQLMCEQAQYHGVAVEEPTAKDVLENLNELVQAKFIPSITIDEFQDLVGTQVSQLAELLGIELP